MQPSLRNVALALTALTSSCFSAPPPSASTPEIEAVPLNAPVEEGQDPEVQSFVDCTNARIRGKIEARRRGQTVPPTTQQEVLDCTGPAFDLRKRN